MKAPEKIYLDPHPFKDELEEYWYSMPNAHESIEYIRTDVFLMKAVNFLKMLGCGFTITDPITHTNYDKEQLVEDFRNCMKA